MIRSINYVSDEAKQKAEQEALGYLMDVFTSKMVDRLMDGVSKGKTGWDDPGYFENLQQQLLENIKSSDWVDVANIAMMIWNIEQK